MKKILCYGDSNTFGFNPLNGKRFDEKTRWSGILKKALFENYEIIEEGLNNRTAFVNNPNGIEYNTNVQLLKILETYNDIKYLILSVGVNDFQFQYDLNSKTLESELKALLEKILNKNIKPIIILPNKLDEKIFNGYFSCLFNEKSILKSKELSKIYQKIASELNCQFIDTSTFTTPSEIDGLHYDETSHRLIAQEIIKLIS